ncbi:hypothetical protein BKM17_23065 [Pseudomonas syringae group genomosp. 3]|nr:hypothetical protein BKM17_23065 [Pseudomonas syringae group genomosp. 3]
MRVPIHPDDLLPRAAFKKLSRSIQKRWPGQSAIQLSFARDTLSRGLGYASYSEARHVSLTSPFEASTSSESAARAGIAAALAFALKSANDHSVTQSALEIFVQTLPLKALTAFKMAASRAAPSVIFKRTKLDPTQSQVSPVNLTCPPKTIPMYTVPVMRVEKSTPSDRPERLISPEEIAALRKAVERSGSLRDQSIFSLLESGLRGHVILSTQVPHVSNVKSSPHQFTILNSKSRPVAATAETIGKYINSAGLAPGGYLFPSKNDPAKPMSAHELLQIFRSWEEDAQLRPPQRSPRCMRNAAIDKLMIKSSSPWSPDQVAKQAGHLSSLTTGHYVFPSESDPKNARTGKTDKE